MQNPNPQLPRQRLPRSQKDEEWKEKTIDAIIDLSTFGQPYSVTDSDLKKAYEYYNGVVDDSDYTHVTKPYGKKRENFPAQLNNYNIIKPVVDLLKGEKARRPFNFTTKVVNDDVTTRKAEKKKQALSRNLLQHFLAELEKQGVDVGDISPDQMPEPPEEVQEAFESDYRDQRAVTGQKALNFLVETLDVERKLVEKAWHHWLVGGVISTKRNAGMDEVEYDILNPLNVDWDKSPDTDYVEDGQWATHRRLSTVADVIDAFYEELTEEEIDQLEEEDKEHTTPFIAYEDKDEDHHDNNNGRMVEVMEVYWKSMKRVGIVTYVDPMGMLQERTVEEGYLPGDDEEVEWYWVTEVWQGYRLDEDIYKRVEPLEVQRRDMDNLSRTKLPINGRRYSDINAPNISLVKLGIPYQITYNIYKFRLANAIAKSKDVIAQLDINLVPDKWDMDTWLYYMDATGIAWTDYNKEEVNVSPQHQTVLDMTVQVIGDYIALLEAILDEWERLSGVSAQRQGVIAPYETQGGSEQAIVQSSYITEDYFSKFAHFEEKELNALLDYSKYAWVNGKSVNYVLPDHSQEIAEIDGIEHLESEYGVVVSNSGEDMQATQQMKQLAQSMMQNGVPISDVIDVLDANSLSGIKDKLKDAEKSRQELAKAQQKAEQQKEQSELQIKQLELQAEQQKAQMDREKELAIERLKQQQEDEELASEEKQAEKDRDLKREELQQEKNLREKEIASRD